jgi:hypothetical protein
MKDPSFWERHAFKILALTAVVFVAMCVVHAAQAAGTSATLTWTHPVVYTDGSTLAATEIKETIITWRRPGTSAVVGSVRVAAPANTTVVTGLTCGSFNFTAATVVRTNDDTSADTAPALYATGVRCAPNPPTGLKVE